ncbi:MAG: hypothetical protein FJ278_14315 [Planctomycetes bacterium]|nr:hypothetical protein [Planctomycetota bacterium]
MASLRTLNYAAMKRGGEARAVVAGKEFPANEAFDGNWLKGWAAPAEAAYPVVLHRDLGKVVRVNRMRVALGPEILACPIVYTHNVNVEGKGVGGSTRVSTLVTMLDWLAAQGYRPIFYSDFLRFVRMKRLPDGVTKPMVLMFCTGQRGIYEHAFGPLKERHLKFVATCWELKGQDERFLTPTQIREMLASGLFEPGIYTKWTTHRFGPDEGPITANTTVAFPFYSPDRNEYESFGAHEERIFNQVDDLVRTLRSDFGCTGEVVWEAPSAFHSLTMLRVARRLGIAMLINTGANLNLYGSQLLPNLGMVSMSDGGGRALVSIQEGVIAVSGKPVVRQYRYEVYISAADQPTVSDGWEKSPDWHKVVFERPGAGVEIDPLYPRHAAGNFHSVIDGLQGSYVKFRHLRLKVLSETGNRPAAINELEVYYECGSESELQEMRLRNMEGEGE